MLGSLSIAIEDYAALSVAAKNESVRLGAIKRRVETQLRRFELMLDHGLVPRTLSDAELREPLQTIFEILPALTTSAPSSSSRSAS